MSKDNESYAKGRADAAKGVRDEPSYGILDGNKEVERVKIEKQNYREGWADKKREMEKEGKR